MAAAGLIVAQNDHAKRAIELGLGAIAAIKTYNSLHNTSFSIRVGIDSGDVVAGIIGKKKFSYDLWGNAVNCASRMETTGIADALHISAHTYAALIDKSPYNFTERPHIYVKGIGEMNTYSVTRAPSTPSPAL